MKISTVKIKTRPAYGAVVARGAADYLPYVVKGAEKALIVSDDRVFGLYGFYIKKRLEESGVKPFTFLFPAGENSKSKPVLDKLLILLTDINLTKSDVIINLGGGTVSDIGGFAAAIFKRGIPYVNIPTTLLSMSDACVGGKTGVDFLGGKNLLGVINQPKAVLCDLSFLDSLNEEAVKDGLCEMIKCAVIGDKKLFSLMFLDEFTLEEGIKRALTLKAKLVAKDEFDLSKRRLLNFGHTFAHALESASGYTVSHGRAVAFGMVQAAEFAEKIYNVKGVKEKIISALEIFQIDYSTTLSREQLLSYTLSDKKIKDGRVVLILPKKIGKCKAYAFTKEKFKEAYIGR